MRRLSFANLISTRGVRKGEFSNPSCTRNSGHGCNAFTAVITSGNFRFACGTDDSPAAESR
jgi:hypothetical protein